jgi:hypothetical protein
MTSRIVRVGQRQQVVTTKWLAGLVKGFTDVHEHVTLQTPDTITETQRLRLMTAREMGRSWNI